MKTYSKTYLPDTITYQGNVYTLNAAISTGAQLNNTPLKAIAATLKKEGRKMVVVNCLSRNLKGKRDLHGKPYEPIAHIYTT